MEQMRELSPEEMNKVSGGQGAEVQNEYNAGDASGTADSGQVCPKSSDGKHKWFNVAGQNIRICRCCRKQEQTGLAKNFF